jgi:hypothetical protein
MLLSQKNLAIRKMLNPAITPELIYSTIPPSFSVATNEVAINDSTSSPAIHVPNDAIIAIPNTPPISTWFALT